MKVKKNPQQLVGIIALVLGSCFLAVAITVFILWIRLTDNFVFSVLSMVFGINAAVWLILGACFYLYAKGVIAKGERLKYEGICYVAESVRIRPNYLMRIGGFATVSAECIYRNTEGKTCLVMSKSFLLDCIYPHFNSKNSFSANIYVSRSNPRDYFVDVYSTAENIQVDYDYRK